MPDLGKYAFIVYASYAASFVLIGGVIFTSIRRYRDLSQRLGQFQSQTSNLETKTKTEA